MEGHESALGFEFFLDVEIDDSVVPFGYFLAYTYFCTKKFTSFIGICRNYALNFDISVLCSALPHNEGGGGSRCCQLGLRLFQSSKKEVGSLSIVDPDVSIRAASQVQMILTGLLLREDT